jgi:hypothetical protein
MQYYVIRILAGLFFMGSFGGGLLVGAEYGKWAGWLSFVSLATIGIILDIAASKAQKA